jgi:hypothetical protein
MLPFSFSVSENLDFSLSGVGVALQQSSFCSACTSAD